MIDELLRLVRFGLVGVANTLLSVATYAVLTGEGLSPGPASALGFAVGAANSFHLNRRWTFHTNLGGRQLIARYVGVQALGAGLSAGGVALASADLDMGRLLAEAMVVPCVTLITYTLVRSLVFRGAELA